MSHSAAIAPAPKARLEVQSIATPEPGPHELLVKNDIIALQPIDAKIARVAMLPLEYPAVFGSSFAGTVVKVGANVTAFAVGDKVVASKTAGATHNKYSAYQDLVVASALTTTKLPSEETFEKAVRLIGNLPTVVALFNVTLKLAKPVPGKVAPRQSKKVLIYGGTSSIGSLSVQYLTQAGYEVVTTTSPRHAHFVSRLGAAHVIDHSTPFDTTVEQLVASGPYDVVLDTISNAETMKINAAVVAAQNGGDVYALQPAFGPEALPAGVTRKFDGWSLLLGREENTDWLKWAFDTYFPQALASDSLVPVSERKMPGGLAGLDGALDVLMKGVSSEKLVVDLRN